MKKINSLGVFLIFFVHLCFSIKLDAKESNQLIIVGDSRTVGMERAISKQNKNVSFFGKVGVGYNYWFANTNNRQALEKVFSKANKRKTKTKVIFWLGINDCTFYGFSKKAINARANIYLKTIKNFAKKYKNIDFYFCSVTPMRVESIFVKNKHIKIFNGFIKKNVQSLKRRNLKYIDVYKYTSKIIRSRTSCPDGLHYSDSVYKKIFKKISSF